MASFPGLPNLGSLGHIVGGGCDVWRADPKITPPALELSRNFAYGCC